MSIVTGAATTVTNLNGKTVIKYLGDHAALLRRVDKVTLPDGQTATYENTRARLPDGSEPTVLIHYANGDVEEHEDVTKYLLTFAERHWGDDYG